MVTCRIANPDKQVRFLPAPPMIFAFIPARGGSVGVPGKNMKKLWGPPLIYWAILAALNSRAEVVCVSTDCLEIASFARWCGAEVVMRPAAISGDRDASELAVNHAIDKLGIIPTKTLMIQCTTPTVTAKDINGLIDKLDDYDCAFLAWETSALLWDGDRPLNHDHRSRPMRQDRMQLEEAGCYAWRGISDYRFFGKIGYYVTDIGIDINDERDFRIAEALVPKHCLGYGEFPYGRCYDREKDN